MKKYLFGSLIALALLAATGGAVARAHGMGGFGFMEKAGSDNIASMLDMTTDELKTELQDSTLPELLDEEGITHIQLEAAREQNMLERQAELLGVTVDELKAELEDKTFGQLLDERGLSHVELQSQRQEQMKAHMTERLQELVDDGTITEEQMQQRLERMGEHHDGMGMGFGRHYRMGIGMH